ncbi:hypothetical protein [Muricoccus radiodurans]|uniref:hypothetical protein n=1 Tax=Muricoccus radiodurans TaxID=2231721 RepID=UPI003CE68997
MAEASITVCTVRSTVPPAFRAEMAHWQREEHIPRLLGVPGYLGVQRFDRIGDDCSFMNIWTMRSRAAFDSPEHDAASHTPWQIRMRGLRTAQEVDFYEPAEGLPWSAFPPAAGRYLLRLDLGRASLDRLAAGAAALARHAALAVHTLRDTDHPGRFLQLAFFAGRPSLNAALAGPGPDGGTLSGYRAVTPPLRADDPAWRELPPDPG